MRRAAALFAALGMSVPADASTLARVLDQISGMGVSPLAAVMMNAAVNAPATAARLLAPGDIVVIGYAADGRPMRAEAGAGGLLVPDVLAAGMTSGLAAGLYPVGSQLYALPPAGQLSLFDAAQDGRRLAQARDLALSRVDGTVTTILRGLILPDLAPTLLASAYQAPHGPDAMQIEEITSTVLGAVNAGEIVLNLQAEWDVGAQLPRIDLALAGIARGADTALSEAVTTRTSSLAARIAATPAAQGAGSMMLNLATNALTVTGAVVQDVQGVTYGVQSTVTTVIGAVNGGRIGGPVSP